MTQNLNKFSISQQTCIGTLTHALQKCQDSGIPLEAFRKVTGLIFPSKEQDAALSLLTLGVASSKTEKLELRVLESSVLVLNRASASAVGSYEIPYTVLPS